jgi:peptidyl-prolyl cis-trans isomerase C
MAHGRQSLWRDVIRRLPVLAAAGVLLAAAVPTPAPAGDKAPDHMPAQPSKDLPAQPTSAEPDFDQSSKTGTEAERAPITGTGDHVVARVEGHLIYLSDLGQAEQALPANMRGLPLETLYPILVNLMVDHQALAMLARRRGLEDDPAVKKQIQQATDRVLEGALLGGDATSKVTEEAIKARYDQLYANRPPTEQVRARHILVATESEATRIIAELKQGADFATLARQDSKDPDGKTGGDLGFLGRDQISPAFADVAFALQPGQVADKPVHNEFGWHVVKLEERRMIPAPSFTDMHDTLREQLTQEAVRQEVALARGQLAIREWNLDGSPMQGGPRQDSTAAGPK